MKGNRCIRGVTFVLLAAFAAAAPAATAATVYVSAANATGVEDGSFVSPFNTIQEGINKAVAGDAVSVAPGIYFGAIELKTDVPVVSEKGPMATIIDGMGAQTVVNPPYDIAVRLVLDGFTVRNGGYLVYMTNRANFWSSSSIEIRNCILRDGAFGVFTMPMSATSALRTVITNVQTGYDGIWGNGANFRHVTVDSVGTAFNMYQLGSYAANSTFSNVGTFVSTWGHRGSAYLGGTNNNVWNYTNLLSAGWNGQLPVLNLLEPVAADPQFVNPLSGNYTLLPGSALIDAGKDIGLPFIGVAPDIGAYESDVSIPELTEALAESVSEIPVGGFRNAGEQLRNALQNKIGAVLHKLDTITDTMASAEKIAVYQDVLDKLVNDISMKADGFFGGNPKNDWLVTQEEQARLREKILPLIDAVNAEIAALQAIP